MSKQLPLTQKVPHCSQLVFGCMGLGGDWNEPNYSLNDVAVANRAIDTALEVGISMFDHADIYTRGKAEQVFGDVLKQRPHLRKDMTIQTKCGIRFEDDKGPGRYDFSKEWILHSVETSLKRLNIEQIDILLLHRPDPLMEPDEVASAFDQLIKQGKVNKFGVSNMTSAQIQLLQQALPNPLVCNQLEISLGHLDCIDQGIIANVGGEATYNAMAGTLEYCQLNDVQVQSWGSLSQGLFSGRILDGQAPHIITTASLVSSLAAEYQTSPEAIVLAFLTRLPQGIQPVIGTVDPDRIRACQRVIEVELTREHWYQLFVAARGRFVP
ncbi:aldo/keto reductase [Psychrosphaera sp. B3R10]|uniref:aldo/keto reductase n=1 Tax=unclassified Psychrosphaera TaxID=2641570 RepID=UPI001C0874BF|nr:MULTISPECIES: aldo/keto reductase [unclassified Psychrosphaera]MBU2882119.1 aldo/keto reductase [Psychrosphaera sp. I2R16]MBU2988800.1 aldo/keto reductase [Psychrosphaera sp. B3R10]